MSDPKCNIWMSSRYKSSSSYLWWLVPTTFLISIGCTSKIDSYALLTDIVSLCLLISEYKASFFWLIDNCSFGHSKKEALFWNQEVISYNLSKVRANLFLRYTLISMLWPEKLWQNVAGIGAAIMKRIWKKTIAMIIAKAGQ